MPKRIVTKKELAYVKSHYKTQSHKSIYEHLGMSKDFYQRLCLKHKFVRKNRIVSKRNTETAYELAYIKAHYLIKPQKALARDLNRSHQFIRDVLKRHKLKIPKKIRDYFGKTNQFKKGNISHNKGKKWSETHSKEGMANSSKTQFKPGNLPHNTLSDGTITVRLDNRGVSYKWIRLAKGVWIPLHKYNWIKKYGPIPANHVIRFKKGTMDCRPYNLELVPLEKHLFYNKFIDYPETLKETKFLLRKLNSKITQHGS